MGFFSRIKKLWGADGEPRDEALSSQAPAQTPEEAPSEAPTIQELPKIEEKPEAHEPQAPQEATPPPSPEPEHEAQPAARTDAPSGETGTRREGGWRRLFGLGGKAEETAPSAESAPQVEPRPAPPAEMLFQEKPVAKDELTPWQKSLQQALGEAEPKLSTWMVHILDGVTRRGDVLWERLRFLFAQLEVPAEEAQDFIRRFDKWLLDMEYDHVDEFRSELQYRMALALELEDEEDERNRLFLKLSAGLGKTREQLTMRIDQLLSMTGKYDDAFWEELEEILLMADVGVNATQELSKRLRPKLRQAAERDAATFKTLMKEELASVFIEPKAPRIPQLPEVVLMIGVNGAGKTTTIAKLAHRAQMQGRKVLVAAGDTFRAAAIEQLQVWSKRVGAGFYAKAHGSDPAAVAFEAVEHAMREGYDLVFVDTAGRLQTKHNLMEELKKINRVLGKKLEGAPHRTILVLDSTTGQNALSQVKLFSQASPVDEIVLTKLDGTAKGGPTSWP